MQDYIKGRDFGITLSSEVDVVVIGGGFLGCATLFHLTKLGIRKPLLWLLEKYQLTAGACIEMIEGQHIKDSN